MIFIAIQPIILTLDPSCLIGKWYVRIGPRPRIPNDLRTLTEPPVSLSLAVPLSPKLQDSPQLQNCKYCEYCWYYEYCKYSCTVLRKKLYFSSAPYLDFLAPVLIAQIFCSLSQQFAVFRFSNLTVSVENLCYNLDWEAQKKKHAAVLPSWPIYTSRSDFLLLRMCSQAAQVCIGLLPISPTVLTNWLLPPHTC